MTSCIPFHHISVHSTTFHCIRYTPLHNYIRLHFITFLCAPLHSSTCLAIAFIATVLHLYYISHTSPKHLPYISQYISQGPVHTHPVVPLHSTALHCIPSAFNDSVAFPIPRTPLRCTTWHYMVLHSTTFELRELFAVWLNGRVFHYISLYCIPCHYIPFHSTALHLGCVHSDVRHPVPLFRFFSQASFWGIVFWWMTVILKLAHIPFHDMMSWYLACLGRYAFSQLFREGPARQFFLHNMKVDHPPIFGAWLAAVQITSWKTRELFSLTTRLNTHV